MERMGSKLKLNMLETYTGSLKGSDTRSTGFLGIRHVTATAVGRPSRGVRHSWSVACFSEGPCQERLLCLPFLSVGEREMLDS